MLSRRLSFGPCILQTVANSRLGPSHLHITFASQSRLKSQAVYACMRVAISPAVSLGRMKEFAVLVKSSALQWEVHGGANCSLKSSLVLYYGFHSVPFDFLTSRG